jgi:N-methylhydantoinase A
MLLVGVDTGGTFTDVVCTDGTKVAIFKVPTQADAPGAALLDGVRKAAALLNASAEDMDRLIHGTTVATNAVVQQKGAVVGILTTEGFTDVLEIGRLKRSKLYDWNIEPETPVFLAPRERRLGVRERLDHTGKALTELDEADVRNKLTELVEAQKVEAVAVCLLFSYLNPAHEQRIREIISEVAPDLPVSLSSEVDPEYREYERTAITAFDAYLKPVVRHYMGRLQEELTAQKIRARLQIMQSRGGIISASQAAASPVNMVLSGPAGGVAAACHIARQTGYGDLITLDIGGTSSDVSLIVKGEPSVTTETKISGYPVRVTMVDVNTIGAGGGSIAWIDTGGRLRVGPHSAGANPGPVCYGRGGKQPTVTDASVLLGYLDPASFAMGQIQLDVAASERALADLGRQLGMTAIETALGIHRVINAAMADQIRLVTVKRGYDAREFRLLAFGGAGPVHAVALADDLDIPTVLVPAAPGVLAAYGLLTANVEHAQKVTYLRPAMKLDLAEVAQVFGDLERKCVARMEEDGISAKDCQIRWLADMRYRGQSGELEAGVPTPVTKASITAALAEFHERHRRAFAYVAADDRVEFVNAKVVVSYSMPKPSLDGLIPRDGATGLPYTRRRTYFSTNPVDGDIYRRSDLRQGDRYSGPAIVEQSDTTLVVPPDHTFALDDGGNILVSRNG